MEFSATESLKACFVGGKFQPDSKSNDGNKVDDVVLD